MAKAAKYTEQFGVVINPTQHDLLKAAAREVSDGKAGVVRFALNLAFGLIKTGAMESELRGTETQEVALERMLAAMRKAGVARPAEEDTAA